MSVIRKRHFFPGFWIVSMMGLVFILTIAEFCFGQGLERIYPDYYPEEFNAIGKIDRIAEKEIVIDDSLFKLSPNVTCYTPISKYVSKALFSVGNRVGVEINSNHEVTSLWLLE